MGILMAINTIPMGNFSLRIFTVTASPDTPPATIVLGARNRLVEMAYITHPINIKIYPFISLKTFSFVINQTSAFVFSVKFLNRIIYQVFHFVKSFLSAIRALAVFLFLIKKFPSKSLFLFWKGVALLHSFSTLLKGFPAKVFTWNIRSRGVEIGQKQGGESKRSPVLKINDC